MIFNYLSCLGEGKLQKKKVSGQYIDTQTHIDHHWFLMQNIPPLTLKLSLQMSGVCLLVGTWACSLQWQSLPPGGLNIMDYGPIVKRQPWPCKQALPRCARWAPVQCLLAPGHPSCILKERLPSYSSQYHLKTEKLGIGWSQKCKVSAIPCLPRASSGEWLGRWYFSFICLHSSRDFKITMAHQVTELPRLSLPMKCSVYVCWGGRGVCVLKVTFPLEKMESLKQRS